MLTSLAGRLLLGFFGLLPPNVALKLGRWLGRHFGMRLLRQKNFQRNFAIAFPEQSTDALVQEAAAHFGAVAAFYPHLRNLREGKRGASLELEGWEHVPEGPAIFIGAHVKFWEAGPLALERTGKRQLMIYSSLGVRWLAHLLQAYREQGANVAFVEKADALRACLEHLKAGGSLGLLMDQRTDSGLDVPFFGRPARFTHLPARLALRFNLPIIPMQDLSDGTARMRARFLSPLYPQGKTELQITAELASIIETIIRQNPGQWFCNKRRWPTKGKP